MYRLIGLVTVLFIPIGAFASPPDDGVTTLERPLQDARTPSGYVDSVDITDTFLDGSDGAERLRAVPGVSVRRQSSLGQPAYAQVRGGNPRQLSVSLDGFRISTPFGAGFDLGALSFAGIDTIQVFRGAAGSVQGGGALTGALNLQSTTLRAPGWRTSAGTFAGSLLTTGLAIDADVAGHSSAVRIAANARQADGSFEFIDGQGVPHTRQNNDHRRAGVMVVGEHRFSPGDRARATVTWDGGERGAPGPSEFQERLSSARLEDQRIIATTRFEQRDPIRLGSVSIDTFEQLGGQWRTSQYKNPSSLLGEAWFRSTSEFSRFGGGLGAKAYAGPLVISLDAESAINHYDSAESGVVEGIIAEQRFEQSLATSVEWAADSWSVMAGSRFEWINGDRFEQAILPSMGASWSPTRWLTLRSNLARTFRVPDFDELYLNIETIRGNADLYSERAWAFDAGAEVGTSILRVGSAYFENRMDSVILFLPVSSSVIEASNVTGATARGIESWIAFAPTRWLLVDGRYTWTAAERDGVALAHQPAHEGGMGTTLNVSPRWSIRSDIHGRSEASLDNFDNLKAPGWISVDAGVHTRPWTWMTVGLTGQNLMDDRTRIDALQQPLPGRTIFASIQLDWEQTEGQP